MISYPPSALVLPWQYGDNNIIITNLFDKMQAGRKERVAIFNEKSSSPKYSREPDMLLEFMALSSELLEQLPPTNVTLNNNNHNWNV